MWFFLFSRLSVRIYSAWTVTARAVRIIVWPRMRKNATFVICNCNNIVVKMSLLFISLGRSEALSFYFFNSLHRRPKQCLKYREMSFLIIDANSSIDCKLHKRCPRFEWIPFYPGHTQRKPYKGFKMYIAGGMWQNLIFFFFFFFFLNKKNAW